MAAAAASAVAVAIGATSCAPAASPVSLNDPIDTAALRGSAQVIVTTRLSAQFTTGVESRPTIWRGWPGVGNVGVSTDQLAKARRLMSPAGSTLRVDRTTNRLIVVNASGAAVATLEDVLWGGPEFTEIRWNWSPDGSKILVVRNPYTAAPTQETNTVYDAVTGKRLGTSFSGSGYRNLTSSPTWETVTFAWKPDSSTIAFSAQDTVKVMVLTIGAVPSTNATLVRSAGLCPLVQDWSVDNRFVFLCGNDLGRPFSGSKRLFTMAVGGGPIRVLDPGVADLGAPDPQLSARFAPGTNQVVFTRTVVTPLDLSTIWNSALYGVDDVPGSSLRALTTARPTISDGVRLSSWVVLEGYVTG